MFEGRKGHNSQTHVIIGFAVLALLYYLNNQYNWYDLSTLNLLDYAFIGFITWVYSQMPDADSPVSRISKTITVVGVGLIIYAFAQGEKTLGIATAIILGVFRIIEHRTIVHSLFGAIVLSAPLWFLKPIYAIIAFIMFLAHIISEGEFSMLFEKDWRLFK